IGAMIRHACAVVGLVILAGCARPPAPCAAPPIAAAAPSTPPTATARGSFDVVVANGRVVDGTGAPWFRADVGIIDDRIAAIGDLSAASAAKRIDVHGDMVAPGFIDMLGQSELNLLIEIGRA